MSWRTGRRERLYRRYEVDGVRGTLHFKQQVRVIDLSAGGMQVETDAMLALGHRYSFQLQQEGKALNVKGEVVWCRLSGTREREGGEVEATYTAGVAFENNLTPEGQELVRFMDSVTLEIQQRLFGRFRVVNSTSANIGEEHEFWVVRLSQSGMLITTDFAPSVETAFSLEIHFDGQTFSSNGRVAYVRDPHEEGKPVELGVEFKEVADDQREILVGFIQREFTEKDPDLESEG